MNFTNFPDSAVSSVLAESNSSASISHKANGKLFLHVPGWMKDPFQKESITR